MSRLIAYGCSYTYGQGLEDCYIPQTHPDKLGQYGPGPNPSNFAWPAHLGRLLRCDVINRARPGSSNKEILWQILNCEHDQDDKVVILWSHVDRHCVILENNQEYPEQYGWWVTTEKSKYYLDYAVKTHEKYDRFIECLMFVELANYYLKDRVQKVYNYNCRKTEWSKIPAWSKIKFLGTANDIWANYPKAEDNGHPGKLGQRKFAQKIYGDIINDKQSF